MSKLSATRTASSLRYHSAFCLSASCHLIVAPAAGKAQAGINGGALPPNTMIKIETAIRYFIAVATKLMLLSLLQRTPPVDSFQKELCGERPDLFLVKLS